MRRRDSSSGLYPWMAAVGDTEYSFSLTGAYEVGRPGPLDIVAVYPDASAPSPPTGGRKDDADKVRYELLPPELLEATAQVLTFGAKKYGDRNWEKGMSWGRPFAALMRHMWAWWCGEAQDAETGYSHLWHAAACVAFLIAYEQRKIGADDRPQK